MNKSYISVWNEALGSWVAASEHTVARGKRSKSRAVAGAVATVVVLAGLSGAASAANLIATPVQAQNGQYSGTDTTSASATGEEATAVGSKASASELGTTAIGAASVANAQNSTAIGILSTASGSGAVALGWNATASGGLSTAIGARATSDGLQGLALGASANVSAATTNGISIGTLASVSATNGTAIGARASVTALNSVALGANSTTTADLSAAGYNPGSTALSGTASAANGEVSVGSAGNERRVTNVAAGSAATDAVNVSQLQSEDAKVNQQGSDTAAALGGGATYNAGTGAISAPSYNVAGGTQKSVGAALTALDSATVQFNGANGAANVNNKKIVNVAAGDLSSSSTDAVNGSQLYATNQQVSQNTSSITNLGDQVTNVYNSGTKYFHANSTGADSSAVGADAVAIGMGAVSSGMGSIAEGMNASASGSGSTAIGPLATATGDSSVAMGVASKATGTNSVALGAGSNATEANSVALGNSSTTAAAVGTSGATIGGTAYSFAGANPTGTVSVGSVGSERTITNVAAGRLSATSTDAVNGSQLYATNQQVDQLSKDIQNAAGNGTDPLAVHYDDASKGTITLGGGINGTKITNVAAGDLSPSSTDAVNGSQLYATNQQVDQNTTSITNLGDQITQVSKTANAGWNVSAQGANATNVAPGATVDLKNTDGNIAVSKDATSNDVSFDLARDLKVDSVTTGGTVVNNNGVTIQGGPSITTGGINAGGKTITNVVNGVNADDAVNKGQLDEVSQSANAGWNVSAQGANVSNVAPGATVDLKNTDGNIAVSKDATSNDVSFDLARDLKVDSVTTGGTVVNNNGVTIQGGPSITTGGINAGGKTITNVVNGVNADDAVNKGQLDEVSQSANAGWNVSAQGANATNVAPGATVDLKNTDGNIAVSKDATSNDVNFDLARDLKVDSVTTGGTVVNNNGVTIQGGPSITTGGINAGGRTITNVVNGVNADDAVNKGQLDEVSQSANAGWNVSAQGANVSNVAPDATVDLKNTDGNIAVSKDATSNDVNFDLARDLKVDSVTTGGTVVNNNGVTIQGGPSITTGGINAGGRTITNVVNGVNADDAVNKGQLDEVSQSANAGWNVSAQGANATNVAPGATVDLKNTDGNIAVSKDATSNDVSFDLARDLNVDSVTTGGTVVNNNGVTIQGGPSITTGGINAGGRTITNVVNGVNADDAVNKGQLDEVSQSANAGWNVSAQGANATNVAPGATVDLKNTDGNIAVSKDATSNDVSFDLARDLKVDSVTTGGTVVNNNGVTIQGGPSITTGGINAGGRTITNVVNGVNADDAVNKGQLDEVSQSANAGWNVSAQGTNVTNVAPGATVDLKNTDGNIAVSKDATSNDVSFDLARDLKVDSVTAGGTVVNNNGVTIQGGPSITTGGINAGGRTITNVVNGVNADDAVNKGQLDEVSQSANAGWNVSAQGANATNVAPGATVDLKNTDGNIAVSKDATSNDVSFDLARDLKVDSVTTGGTVVNNNGVTIQGGPSITTGGINAGGRTITNVANGVADSDAVNVSQLNAVDDKLGNLDAGSVKYDTNADGTTVNRNSITLAGDTYDSVTHVGGTRITNVADGVNPSDAVNMSQLTETNDNLANLGDQVTKAGDQISNVYNTGTKYFHANSTGVDSSADGQDSVAIGMGAVAKNTNDVALGAGSTTEAAVGTASATIGGTDHQFAGAKPNGTVSVGSEGNERTITNVAAGRLSEASTDAVNGSQLYATNQALDQINSNITNLDQGSVKYDRYSDGTVNYNSVTLGGGMSSGPVVLTNVANGKSTYDAVNFGQLSALQDQVSNIDNRVTGIENNGGGASNPYFNATDTSSDDEAVVNEAVPGTGKGSTAAGSGATAAGDYGTAVGSNSSAADSAVAVGAGASAASGSVAIGQGSQATAANAVALGQGSVADRANTVSVGTETNQRQITNVAAGTQATDAVNVSQLTSAVGAMGGGASVNPDGSVTGPSYQLSGGTYSNVGDALSNLDSRVNAANQAIDNVAKGAYSGIAAATALTMIPDVDKDKTLSLGIGGGTYKGYQAVAIGGTARITQNIKMKAGVGLSSGGTTAGVGASYQW
ncbi:YadA-like family protein [Paraburkholderia susongensis]|uniref:Head domain of trimeric autotransporter adhesin n=1 Tax=Paraburkholderia susongensis TaxID=1515439 RepID=A0A1X7LSN4_9BURK|nr:YadA-like family protein [Paraburkholderia susongensis]SMG56333.1 Head domain of trimeric autotransporter adhesin [Paraburkholderia susongensis]